MHILIFTIIIGFVSIHLVTSQSTTVNKSTSNCYVDNHADNQSAWRLQWEDTFERKNLSQTNDWDVQHEAVFCGGKQVTC